MASILDAIARATRLSRSLRPIFMNNYRGTQDDVDGGIVLGRLSGENKDTPSRVSVAKCATETPIGTCSPLTSALMSWRGRMAQIRDRQ